MKLSSIPALAAIALVSFGLMSQSPPRLVPGELPGGVRQLVNGWRVKPAGVQIRLGTNPSSSVTTPDGKYLVVLSSGSSPVLTLLEEPTLKEIAQTPVPGAWMGLAINKTGDRIYVGGGSEAAVFEFALRERTLHLTRRIDLVDPAQRVRGDFAGDLALSPDGERLYVAQLLRNGIDVVNLASGKVEDRFGTGRRPYRIVPHPNGEYLYVSSWADGTIYRHRAASGELLDKLPLASHTTDMLFVPGEPPHADEDAEAAASHRFEARLFVAAANTNNVYVLGVEASGRLERIDATQVSLTSRQPVGMTPSALAYDAERRWLYVVCSDANAVAVLDVAVPRANVLGFLPTGEYPLAARVLSKGRLIVLNAPGSGSVLARFNAETLVSLTRDTLSNSSYRDERLINAGVPAGNPIPNVPGEASPIKHVIYVLRAGSTYDETLGDLPQGNGDPSLTTYGEAIAPNIHKLAREFVLFDNFYTNGARATESWAWASAAIAPDFVRRMPPGYPSDADPAATPPGGYLWTNASLAGVSMRSYGWAEGNRAVPRETGTRPASLADAVLEKTASPAYSALDPSRSDADRVKLIVEELNTYERTGNLPRLLLIRLAGLEAQNSVDAGDAARKQAAESDLALGLLIEAISKSPFWNDTAIFVMESPVANGRDHVHPQRSPVLLISPYIRRGSVDSNFYNTTSALRTMELILGLRPMTMFDAGSFPMWTSFQQQPDSRGYTHVAPRL
ncbi:MAG: hypothetical protein LC114_07090 [Bryobacterales bacterium]|nr:hypothetical protein [Bryobacterales bacterium]